MVIILKIQLKNGLELKEFLFKPIRVCGMVKNEGEPGGGPFWVENNGEISLQIVESSQIDLTNQEQFKIYKESTHFNPVDLVCNINNYQGHKYKLQDFIDFESGFISEKSYQGSKIKVTLNGTVITEADLKEATKNGTLDRNEHPGLKNTTGHIGFLGHGDVVRFKNMRIKNLGK